MTTPVYTQQTWANGQIGGTPINAARLNHMETGIASAEETLLDTGVKTANYTAVATDFVRADTSGGGFAIQLPTAPPSGTTIGIKLVKAGNTLTINRGGSDVFNIAGGSTALTLMLDKQSILLEYYSGIWIVESDGFPPLVSAVAATVSASGALTLAAHNPVDATGATRAMTIANASGPGQWCSVEKTDSSANTVTITGNIRGVGGTTLTLTNQNESVILLSRADGSWFVPGGFKSKAMLDSMYLVGQRVGSTKVTTPQTTASTTIADATGFTVTFTAVTGQTYEIRAKMFVSNNTAGDGIIVQLTDAANAVLDVSPTIVSRTANDQFMVMLQAEVTPSAGSVTYKLRFAAVTGGTAAINASATQAVPVTATRIG